MCIGTLKVTFLQGYQALEMYECSFNSEFEVRCSKCKQQYKIINIDEAEELLTKLLDTIL